MNKYLVLYKFSLLGNVNQCFIHANTHTEAELSFISSYKINPLSVTFISEIEEETNNEEYYTLRIGDYVEGYEQTGIDNKIRKMRGTINTIRFTPNGNIHSVHIRADDYYKGSRGTVLLARLGEIRRVEYEEHWIESEKENRKQVEIENDNVNRNFKENDIIEDTNKVRYKIIGIANNNNKELMIFRRCSDKKLLAEDIEEFKGIDSENNIKYTIVDRR